MQKRVEKITKLKGIITIPSDKSISHRALMIASLTKGLIKIHNFSKGADCLATFDIIQKLGVKAEFLSQNTLLLDAKSFICAPKTNLYCANSGTTMRLMSGILAGQNFNSVLTGDESLSKRPMGRIIEPLELMGAKIIALKNKNTSKKDIATSPIKIFASNLEGISYHSPIASAQVKSCVLLAGLHANGKTKFTEPHLSRNHTELMLKHLEANISDKNEITIEKSELTPKDITIPGDISSAAFFIAAALLVKNSEIIIKNVGLNPTRTGFLDVIKTMGAQIEILDEKIISNEIVGDIKVKTSDLKGCTIQGEIIPRLIDEIPIIAVLATQAQGTTVIKDAKELRKKESDRISTLVNELKKLGAKIEELPDGFIIEGETKLQGNVCVESFHDHRIAMSLFVAGLICTKPIIINDFEWINISFPEFESLMTSIIN